LSYPADGGGISPRLSGREKPLVSSRDIRRGRVAPRSPLDFVRLRGSSARRKVAEEATSRDSATPVQLRPFGHLPWQVSFGMS